MNKTLCLKILDQKKIKYQFFEYDEAQTEGSIIAATLKEDPNCVFKTLVTTNNNG